MEDCVTTDEGMAKRNGEACRCRLPSVCVVVPVCNEEMVLRANICRLTAYLRQNMLNPWEVIIAENGSADETLKLARGLAGEIDHLRVISSQRAGRGRALKHAWLASDADILAYMDADLSTDLGAVTELIGALQLPNAGRKAPAGYDLSIGSRLLDVERTARCLKREILSRGYNLLVRALLHPPFKDAQCGFKAITHRAAQHLLPLVKDNNWFFDTELLLLAQRHGYRIYEFPVKWSERRESHVRLWSTVVEDLRGIWRMRKM